MVKKSKSNVNLDRLRERDGEEIQKMLKLKFKLSGKFKTGF